MRGRGFQERPAEDAPCGVGLRLLELGAARPVEGIAVLRGSLAQLLDLVFGHLRAASEATLVIA